MGLVGSVAMGAILLKYTFFFGVVCLVNSRLEDILEDAYEPVSIDLGAWRMTKKMTFFLLSEARTPKAIMDCRCLV